MAKKKIISKDIPLAELTLRKYEKPANLSDRELIRKLCLSIGILQPGDSRDVIVDIFYAFLEASKKRKHLSMKDIETAVVDLRKRFNLPLVGITAPNITRQVRRLKDISLLEKAVSGYRVTEFSSLHDLFEEKIESTILSSINSRIKDYLKKIDNDFRKDN